MVGVFLAAGVGHFVNARPFVQSMPTWMPGRDAIVAVTGVMEIAGGLALLLDRRHRRPISIALAVFLVAVFPANIYPAVSQVDIDGLPTGWVRWARLPFQPLLVALVLYGGGVFGQPDRSVRVKSS